MQDIVFSDFTHRTKLQPNLGMMRLANELKAGGQDIIHLEVGDSTSSFKNPVLQEVFAEIAQNPTLGYGPAEGIYDLRARVADIYRAEKNVPFGADNVTISAANSFLFYYCAALCNAGDTILIPDPGYHVFYMVAESLNLNVIPYPAKESDGWAPDIDFIYDTLAKTSVKAIIINNPSNPLGMATDGGHIDKILQRCYQHGVQVLMDETYKNLIYDGTNVQTPHYPNMCYLYSFSKDVVCPAFRIGTLVGDKDLIQRITNVHSLIYSSTPLFIQETIVNYLDRNYDYTTVFKDAMIPRIDRVCNKLAVLGNKISFVKPNSAFYLFINISKISTDSDQFCVDLLHKTGVCVCPGNGFGVGGEKGYIRLNLSVDETVLDEGIARIIDYISQLDA